MSRRWCAYIHIRHHVFSAASSKPAPMQDGQRDCRRYSVHGMNTHNQLYLTRYRSIRQTQTKERKQPAEPNKIGSDLPMQHPFLTDIFHVFTRWRRNLLTAIAPVRTQRLSQCFAYSGDDELHSVSDSWLQWMAFSPATLSARSSDRRHASR
jgi:hypothetical protein